MIIRRLYGSGPLHLLGHLLVFGLAGYAVFNVFDQIQAGKNFLVWLVGAVVLHDAILWPLYSGANTLGTQRLGRVANHVRVPLGLSLLLLIVFAGTITGKGSNAYRNTSTLAYHGYVLRWLVVTAVLFVVSAVVYFVRDGGSGPASHPGSPPPQ